MNVGAVSSQIDRLVEELLTDGWPDVEQVKLGWRPEVAQLCLEEALIVAAHALNGASRCVDFLLIEARSALGLKQAEVWCGALRGDRSAQRGRVELIKNRLAGARPFD